MNSQYIIIALVLAFAIGYAIWRTYKIIRSSDDPCCNCGCCDKKCTNMSAKAKNLSCEKKK